MKFNQWRLGFLTSVFAFGCSGPAGVAPQQGQTTTLQLCGLSDKLIQTHPNLTIDASACTQFAFRGEAFTIPEGSTLTIKNIPDVNIENALTIGGALVLTTDGRTSKIQAKNNAYSLDVTGRLDAENMQWIGPSAITLGNESSAPKSVALRHATFDANESGAPHLKIYGDKIGCDSAPALVPPYDFNDVQINELEGHSLSLEHAPDALNGLTFNGSNPFDAQLGDLCIGTGASYRLFHQGVTYHAGNIVVRGTLALEGASLLIHGPGLSIDQGSLLTTGRNRGAGDENTSGDTQISFGDEVPQSDRVIRLSNDANADLQHTKVAGGRVEASHSNLSLSHSTIEAPCSTNAQAEGCQSEAGNAAVTLSDGARLQIDQSTISSQNDQVRVADQTGAPSQITTTGDAQGFEVSTQSGIPFSISRRHEVREGFGVSAKVADLLVKLNGTYESPCVKSDSGEISYIRRYTYDNQFNAWNDQLFSEGELKATRLYYARTIMTFNSGNCTNLMHTAVYSGPSLYYAVTSEGPTGQVEDLTNYVFYGFNNLTWTYHDQQSIDMINQDSLCEINTWQAGVAQDITKRKCYGEPTRFSPIHDRYELLSNGNLLKALDFDERPDELQDKIPKDVNRQTEYKKVSP